MPNLFNLDDDVRAFLLRLTATLDNVDNALAEYQQLATEARATIDVLNAEIAAVRALREKVLK